MLWWLSALHTEIHGSRATSGNKLCPKLLPEEANCKAGFLLIVFQVIKK